MATSNNLYLQLNLSGIVENLISDFIFIIISIIIWFLWIQFSRRRELNSFFHTSETKSVSIYLSNLRVLPFSSIGINGRKMSYEGTAVDHSEIQSANNFRILFNYLIPDFSEVSKLIGKLLFSDVSVQISSAPLHYSNFNSQETIISLGSPAYNSCSSYIESLDNCVVNFEFGSLKLSDIDPMDVPPMSYSDSDASTYKYPNKSGSASYSDSGMGNSDFLLNPAGTASYFNNQHTNSKNVNIATKKDNINSAIIIPGIPRFEDTRYGFIERIINPQNGQCFFYVAGLSTFSTSNAALYLVKHWKDLSKKFTANQSFIVLLKFDDKVPPKYEIVLTRETP